MKALFTKLLIFLFLLFIFVFFNKTIFASCIQSTIIEQKNRAGVVVIGKVVKIEEDYVNVLVEKTIKGEVPSQIQVTGQQASGRGVVTSVDFTFSENKKYLLFLQNDPSNIFKTDICSGSKEITDGLTLGEKILLNDNKVIIIAGGIIMLGLLFLFFRIRKRSV